MNLHSKYLDIDLESTLYFDSKTNKEFHIIANETLEDKIYNHPKCIANEVKVDYSLICSEPGHYAMFCCIQDKNGRKVTAIGESTNLSLTTEIGQSYPVLMAFKRAFSDATIKFLQLPKAYSDQQIDVSQWQKEESPSASVEEGGYELEQPSNAVVTEDDPRFSQQIPFGRNKGKTLKDLWNEGPEGINGIKWMAYTMNPAREETALWKNIAKDFLKLKGVYDEMG